MYVGEGQRPNPSRSSGSRAHWWSAPEICACTAFQPHWKGGRTVLRNATSLKTRRSPTCRSRSNQERVDDGRNNSAPHSPNSVSLSQKFCEGGPPVHDKLAVGQTSDGLCRIAVLCLKIFCKKIPRIRFAAVPHDTANLRIAFAWN
jgi:hypothetical protein